MTGFEPAFPPERWRNCHLYDWIPPSAAIQVYRRNITPSLDPFLTSTVWLFYSVRCSTRNNVLESHTGQTGPDSTTTLQSHKSARLTDWVTKCGSCIFLPPSRRLTRFGQLSFINSPLKIGGFRAATRSVLCAPGRLAFHTSRHITNPFPILRRTVQRHTPNSGIDPRNGN